MDEHFDVKFSVILEQQRYIFSVDSTTEWMYRRNRPTKTGLGPMHS